VREKAVKVANGRRKRRSSEEIKGRLVASAMEEFKRQGFSGATTAEIAHNAEVSETQLFRYFDSKVELFHEAISKPLNRHLQAFNAKHTPAATTSESIVEGARLYISELQQFLTEHEKMLMSLVVAQKYSQPAAEGLAEIEGLQTYFERSAALMAKRAGSISELQSRLMVRVSFAAILGCIAFKECIFPAGVFSDEEISAAVSDFVLEGIGPSSDIGLKKKAPARSDRKRGGLSARGGNVPRHRPKAGG
jgi:AcrR family transcriptional regulator